MISPAAETGLYQAGTGKVDITPSLGVPYLGFAPRHSPFTGVHDPLFVRSAVISDGKKTAALISAETIGFINTVLGPGRDFTDEVRSRIQERTGIPKEAVMLASAHVHSSPDTIDIRPLRETPEAVPWLEDLIDKIALSVELAVRRSSPARLKIAQSGFSGFSRNRRGEDCLDETVTLLSFESPDGRPKILLVNYACHPVIVQAQDRVSADYVGAMASYLENQVSGIEGCLFLQGACGDINPRVDDTRDFGDVKEMGESLGRKVENILRRISGASFPEAPVSLDYASETLELPSRHLPSPAKPVEAVGASSGTASPNAGEAADADAERLDGGRMGLEDELSFRRREGTASFPAEIQVLKIGGAVLAGIPGEAFCRMGLAVRSLANPRTGVPVGYANGYVGYIAPPESWAKGGYEIEPGPWSKVGPESYGLILKILEKLIAGI